MHTWCLWFPLAEVNNVFLQTLSPPGSCIGWWLAPCTLLFPVASFWEAACKDYGCLLHWLLKSLPNRSKRNFLVLSRTTWEPGELGRESSLCCSIEGCLLPSLLPLLALCKSSTLKHLRQKRGQKAAQFSALSSLPNMSFMSPPPTGTTGVGRDRARPIYILLPCFFLPLQYTLFLLSSLEPIHLVWWTVSGRWKTSFISTSFGSVPVSYRGSTSQESGVFVLFVYREGVRGREQYFLGQMTPNSLP